MFSTDLPNPKDYENEKEYLEVKKWINDKLNNKHTKKTSKNGTKSFTFNLGIVWVGEK